MMNNNKTNVQVTVIHTILRGEQRETEGEGEGEGEGGGGRKGKRRDSCSGSFLKDRTLLSLGNCYSDY